jgi:murein tripeptide amidase MpaA
VVEAAHIIGIRFFIFSFFIFFNINPEGLHYGEIRTNSGGEKLGRNFDVTNGRAACEARSAT